MTSTSPKLKLIKIQGPCEIIFKETEVMFKEENCTEYVRVVSEYKESQPGEENIRDSMSFLFVYPARVAPSGGLHQNKSVGRFVIARFSNIRGDISRSLRFVKAPLGCHVGLEHLVLDSTLKQTWSTFHLNNRRSKRVKIGYFESPRILVSFGKSTPPTTEIFQDTK